MIQDHPAVSYVKTIKNLITDDMVIALPFKSRRYGIMYHQFTAGSVMGYAME